MSQKINDQNIIAVYALRDWFFKTFFSDTNEGFKGEAIPAQKDVSNQIIRSVILPEKGKSSEEIFIEFARQSGKTTVVVLTCAFLMIYYHEITGKRLRLGIFAPQREQTKTDFDRLKEALESVQEEFELIFDEYNANTITLVAEPKAKKPTILAQAYVFPITETSNPESKTLDLLIFEEAHLLTGKRETKMKASVFPMGASTNAPRIFIGTAGTQICYFYRGINDPKKQAHVYPAEVIMEQRRKLYEKTGNSDLLKYELYIKGEQEKLGIDSDEYKLAYRLIWVIGTGQFTTREALLSLLHKEVKLVNSDRDSPCYVGIDTAKNPDSTVVTVLRWNSKLKRKELIFWLELRGENYQDQFDIIEEVVIGVQRDEKRQIIRNEDSSIKYKGGFRIIAIAIDSTGQGDFMPDMFEKHTEFDSEHNGLYRVKFSLNTKDVMYKGLQVVISNKLTALPSSEIIEKSREGGKFVQQTLDLQKEYKGQMLSVKHPDNKDAHDDYPDSWALAEYAYSKEQEKPEPDVRIL